MPEAISIYDDRLKPLLRPGASLQKVVSGAVWSEGPVYFHEDDSVVWSDAHGNRLLRWSSREGMSVLRDPSDYQSGNYRVCARLSGANTAANGWCWSIATEESASTAPMTW